MRYIKFTITEREGDHEYDHNMVAEIPSETSLTQLQKALNAFLLNFYSNSEWDDSDYPAYKVWTGNNTLCWISDEEQINESHFSVLRQHMNNQSFNINQYLTNP